MKHYTPALSVITITVLSTLLLGCESSSSDDEQVDSVTPLKNYANKNSIKSGIWHLVTGEKQQIYQFAKEAYFASENLGSLQNTDDFLHTESLLLTDNNRRIRGIYNGLNIASVNYLIADITTLKSGS